MTSILPSGAKFRPEELRFDDAGFTGRFTVSYFPPHVLFAAEMLKFFPESAYRFGPIERQPPQDPPVYDDSVCIDADNGAGLYRLGPVLENGSREGVIEGLRPGLHRGAVRREQALNAAIAAAIVDAEAEHDDEAADALRKEFKGRLA